jgi:hypothetical protein
LDVYVRAAGRGWVVPTFCSENLTTTEAILSAVKEYADRVGGTKKHVLKYSNHLSGDMCRRDRDNCRIISAGAGKQ